MNRSHLTNDECAQLYAQWCEKVAGRVRAAAAKAQGRPDRHRGDLVDLHRDLAAVDLRGLLESEPEAQPGTALQAVAEADVYLAEAEQQHACGAYKAAVVWLQQAYIAANRAIGLLTRASDSQPVTACSDELAQSGLRAPGRPEHAPAQTEGPDNPDWFARIPAPRRPR